MVPLNPPLTLADAVVFHARLRPNGLSFRYRLLAVFVDIDRLDAPPCVPFFSLGRFNLLSFDVRDHGPRDGSALRPYIDRLHGEAFLPRPNRVTLVCFPRILGFVFNPIAIYVCADSDGRTTSVAYEVRNTFGQHHTYLMAVQEDAGGVVAPHECDKVFYVSPFMDMALRYRFRLSPPRHGTFTLRIIESDREGTVLTALMQAKAFASSPFAILRRLAATPLLGFKVVAAIHWQALRLWLRGHQIRPRPLPPAPVSRDLPGEYTLSASPEAPDIRHA